LPMRPPDPQQPRDAYLRANANLHPSHGTYVTALEFNRFGQFWLGDGEFEGKRYFSASLK